MPDPDGKSACTTRSTSRPTKISPGSQDAWFILWAAYRWTGDKKYVVPFRRRSSWHRCARSTPTRSTSSTSATPGARRCCSPPRPDRRDDAGNTRGNQLQLAWQVTGNTDYLNKALRLADRDRGRSRVHQPRGQPLDRPHLLQQRRAAARAGSAASPSCATTSIPATW